MLLSGQPLHAFDLDKVPDGELIVRTAAEGRDDDHPRRGRAQLRRRDGPGLRPRRPLGDRRDHGRGGLRGLRLDHPGAARGRDLERGQHPAHLAQARPALRGLQPLREAAPPRAGDARPADRLAAAGRGLRGEDGPGDDRRGRRDPGGPRARAAPRRGGAPARDADRGRAVRRVPDQARLRGPKRRGAARRCGCPSTATTTSPARST